MSKLMGQFVQLLCANERKYKSYYEPSVSAAYKYTTCQFERKFLYSMKLQQELSSAYSRTVRT
jgi:hypothetical protein